MSVKLQVEVGVHLVWLRGREAPLRPELEAFRFQLGVGAFAVLKVSDELGCTKLAIDASV